MKKKIAFICLHNSARSQIAEALGRYHAADVFDCYSAGTKPAPAINRDAVRLMLEMFAIDMAAEQRPKKLSDIPKPDLVISMGCEVACPYSARAFDDNWQLVDPTGQSDEVFKQVIQEIEKKILLLKAAFLKSNPA